MNDFFFPDPEKSAVVAVDLQEKLLPVISGNEEIRRRAEILLRGCEELGMVQIFSEQYPKGLGPTVPEIAGCPGAKRFLFEKRSFSLFEEPVMDEILLKTAPDTLIFCGVEAHICVLQSIFDALDRNYQVILAADACGSRRDSDKALALDAARQAGAFVLSAEAILFMLMRTSAHPAFKAVSKLIK